MSEILILFLFIVGWIISGLVSTDRISQRSYHRDFLDWFVFYILIFLGGYFSLLAFLIIKLGNYLEDKEIPERYK